MYEYSSQSFGHKFLNGWCLKAHRLKYKYFIIKEASVFLYCMYMSLFQKNQKAETTSKYLEDTSIKLPRRIAIKNQKLGGE